MKIAFLVFSGCCLGLAADKSNDPPRESVLRHIERFFDAFAAREREAGR
jgi:hypothetical protein